MKLSEKLMKLRKEKGLSQEEFGNEINVSRQSVSKWENDEARPDIDKVKEIVKKFQVSYNYLLNDEMETEEEDITNISSEHPKKHKSKSVLKVILVILLIYLFICIYKFIAFYRFYLTADSFSEEKYWMSQTFETSDQFNDVTFNTTKVDKKILHTSYSFENLEAIKDENGNIIPYGIEFTDIDKKISYRLNYDKDKKMYIYQDRKEEMTNDEEIEELFKDENIIKENTLAIIPSSLKEIFLASIDPRYYYVSMKNRQFKNFSFSDNVKRKVQLNKDYLVESITQKFEYNNLTSITFSYDYVPDHFEEIKDPSEKYSNKILYDEL